MSSQCSLIGGAQVYLSFGFIASDEAQAKYGCDVFVVGHELNGAEPGQTLRFQVGENVRGQPQALDCTVCEGSAPPIKRPKTEHVGVPPGPAVLGPGETIQAMLAAAKLEQQQRSVPSFGVSV
eukprot:TRINITY_DN29549_c0_g1_i4.p1 TRINITY_DN29549_c0_g1~~TRINITY_DN29549_c0_g1_i4.p1  ORF type:complete len:123 (-),score=14.28 TRINITY_DN29549_c0_g1_i4:69-437(-)